ncbi:MAG: fumarylacetoacetate hydrolase family protein [Hylemonella sp.]|nr:fumarylacetoacetate hydrolase family protein [Hylemonella sp.]
MKLATFDLPDGSRHIGAVLDDGQQLVDFSASSKAPAMQTMLALIDGGAAALDEARQLLSRAAMVRKVADIRLAAALPEPRQMRDFLCFEKHFRQARANRYLFTSANTGAAAKSGGPFGAADTERDPAKVEIPAIWYQEPIYYKCNRFSVIGTGTDIINPSYCKMLDYELEFAAILGKGGVNISREQARSHIFGYCIFNDVSARDQQMREMAGSLGPSKGKDFDTGNVIGPWLVTADEIPDPYKLTMVARVNGEEWSRGNSGEMYHKFEDVLAHVSRDETLYPGEFFGSGTVGSGCGLELGKFLKHGDVVELEVQGLGVLKNRVVFR